MQPLDPEVHYGITDRTYLDRNPVQMELLPEKLRELRWKLGAPQVVCPQQIIEPRQKAQPKGGERSGFLATPEKAENRRNL
jgi:hypothetical protein